MYTIQWSVDSLDWKDSATPESICKRVTSKVCPGSIVLFHNDADHTPEALPTILKCLKEEGYEFVFISDLILKENYEIKHDGTQCKKDDANQHRLLVIFINQDLFVYVIVSVDQSLKASPSGSISKLKETVDIFSMSLLLKNSLSIFMVYTN